MVVAINFAISYNFVMDLQYQFSSTNQKVTSI